MNGRILEENLERIGIDRVWLMNELKAEGYSSHKQVFLALCNENKELSIFRYKKCCVADTAF